MVATKAKASKARVQVGDIWRERRRSEHERYLRVERIDGVVAHVSIRFSPVGRFSAFTDQVKVSAFKAREYKLWRRRAS